MRWNLAIAFFGLGLLTAFGCQSPAELADPGTNPYTNNELSQTACNRTDLPDSDGDGLNDECEKILGTDPFTNDSNNNGIPDPADILPPPPGTQTETYTKEKEAWWQTLMKAVGPSLTGGSAALTGKTADGTKVAIEVQRLRISQGNEVGTDPDWAGISAFCGSTNFVYFYVKSKVTYCPGGDPTAPCDGTPVDANLKLCSIGSVWSPSPDATDGVEKTLAKITWNIGEANGLKFNPKVLDPNKNGTPTTFDLSVTPWRYDSSSHRWITNIRSKWTSNWTVSGVATDAEHKGQYTVQPSSIQIFKNWQRFDLNYYTTDKPPKGILGNWANQANQ